MNKPSIVLYKKLPADLHQRLKEHFAITEFDGITDKNRAEVFDALQNAEGLLGSGGKIDKELFDHAPRLRGVSTISVGYDNFDVAELTRREIPMMHTPTALTDTVADTVMALVLSTARRVVNVAERVKAGEWNENIGEDWFGIDVHHKTMGIVGMGRIGLALAQRAHFGFDMPILYNARSQHKEAEEKYGARKCELDELLKESDFVCILLPMTEQTFHLIGKEELAKMKSSAILVSAGRGPVIDEPALIEALKAGTIYGAGMDVFETEPLPKDSPLLSLPNVVALPHIGSATHETRYDMAACAVDNLIAALKDDVKQFCVNPEVLKK